MSTSVAALFLAPFYFAVATFGISYFLLRQTPFAAVSLFAPAVVGLPVFVVALSLGGYAHALSVPLQAFVAAAIAGPLFSLIAIALYAPEIKALLIDNRVSIFAAHGFAFLGYLITLTPHLLNMDLGYFEFMNGEFMNYAQITNAVLGKDVSQHFRSYVIALESGRDGIDFINALQATALNEPPANTVQITSAAFRYSAIGIVFYVLHEVLRLERRRLLWTCVFCAALSIHPLDTYHYMSSFMAANLALAPLVGFTLLLLVSKKVERTTFVAIAVIKDFFLLVTYPEMMPFAKIFEFAFACHSYVRGEQAVFRSLLLANLCVVALNPILVLEKIKFVYATAGLKAAGVDIFGLPQVVPLSFFRRIIGYEFPWLVPTRILNGWIVLAAFVINVLVFCFVSVVAGRGKVGLGAALIPAFIAFFAIQPTYLQSLGVSNNYYGLVKVVLILLPFLPLLMAYAFTTAREGSLLRYILITIVGMNLVAHSLVLARTVKVFNNLPSFHSASFARQVEAIVNFQEQIVIGSAHPHVVQYWGNILSWMGADLRFVSRLQEGLFDRSFTRVADGPERPHDETGGHSAVWIFPSKCQWFDGLFNITISPDSCQLVTPPLFSSLVVLQNLNYKVIRMNKAEE